MIQTETCPWCQARIDVSCGLHPCPECGELMRVTPDIQISDLIKLVARNSSLWDMAGKIMRVI